MTEQLSLQRMLCVLKQPPQAVAKVYGSKAYSAISGQVNFYQMSNGVLVAASVTGLPNGILGFHIHTGSRCSGTADDPFANTLTHYNPENVPHPNHAGDMPPLFSNHGCAFQVFFTDRFSVKEIIRKTVVIHSKPDDFTSQSAGNAGEKIACGEIMVNSRC